MNKRFLGIDIGSYNIKIAEMELTKASVTIGYNTIVKTPRFLAQNGRLAQKDELIKLFKETLSTGRFKSMHAVIILNDTLVVTRDMEMPQASPNELEQMVKLNASEYLPSDINEYTIRHRILLPDKLNPKNTNYILMAAIKNNLASDFYDVFCKAGLKPVAIDVTVNSMIKYMQKTIAAVSSKPQTSESIAIMDMGASSVKLVIFNSGNPLFMQVMNHSSQKIDVLIASTLNIERDQAEDYKIKYGLGFLKSEIHEEMESAVGSIINTQVDLLLNDVYKHLRMFTDRNPDKPVTQILLTGGMSLLKGLSSYIQEAFNISCSIVQANTVVDFAPDKTLSHNEETSRRAQIPFYTNIAGAAFRGD